LVHIPPAPPPAPEFAPPPPPPPTIMYSSVIEGVRLVSFIVTEDEVATMVPLVLSVLTLAVNVSDPSVVVSAVGVTEKLPALFVIVNEPELVPKSPEFVTVQYNVVLFGTLIVATLKVKLLPSSTDPDAGVTA
jgi:hypothetical protein